MTNERTRASSWHPTTVARRQVARLVGTPPRTVLVGERHARQMGSARTACGAYVFSWPMDLTEVFDPQGTASCSECIDVVQRG